MPTLKTIEFDNNKIYVKSEDYLNKWVKKEMVRVFNERLEVLYQRFEEKIPYPKLRIRSMKTRWGVCNRKLNTVTLNAKLIRESIDCLDYVIIHELSHFVHFDHSKYFWSTVEKYCKDYKKTKKKLKE